jgi:hypothetical protein
MLTEPSIDEAKCVKLFRQTHPYAIGGLLLDYSSLLNYYSILCEVLKIKNVLVLRLFLVAFQIECGVVAILNLR